MCSPVCQSPPLPIATPDTEGKGQLPCIIPLELLFILYLLHSFTLEGNVEQGFPNLGTHQIHLEGLLKTQIAGPSPRVADPVSLGLGVGAENLHC